MSSAQQSVKAFLVSLALVMGTTLADAQGTIQIANNAGTRFLIHGSRPITADIGGPQPARFAFGVFVGLMSDSLSTQPVLPLATNTQTGGLIYAQNPEAYPIPGFVPGEKVFIQVRGWEIRFGTDWQRARDEGLFGQTAIRPFVLGPANGPGTVVWSSTDLEKFQAINLVPEPSPFVFAGLGFVSLCMFRLVLRKRPA